VGEDLLAVGIRQLLLAVLEHAGIVSRPGCHGPLQLADLIHPDVVIWVRAGRTDDEQINVAFYCADRVGRLSEEPL
jgi:hypothetical protein